MYPLLTLLGGAIGSCGTLIGAGGILLVPTLLLLYPYDSPYDRQHFPYKGRNYSYSFSNRRGVLLSFSIGWLASMLGIGGGPFHVPALVYLLIGLHSKRRLFDIGSTAQALCKRAPVAVVTASPAQ